MYIKYRNPDSVKCATFAKIFLFFFNCKQVIEQCFRGLHRYYTNENVIVIINKQHIDVNNIYIRIRCCSLIIYLC